MRAPEGRRTFARARAHACTRAHTHTYGRAAGAAGRQAARLAAPLVTPQAPAPDTDTALPTPSLPPGTPKTCNTPLPAPRL